MNFFEQQDRAKRQSGLLMLLMTLAVLSLITLISLAIGLALRMSNAYHGYADPSGSSTGGVDWALVGGVALAVIAVVSLGSLYKSVQMSRGGKVVAQRLGGRLINLEPQTFEERRLLNVVEEMAIAAGTPVPAVYVLDDLAINAFAAGLTPVDSPVHSQQAEIEGRFSKPDSVDALEADDETAEICDPENDELPEQPVARAPVLEVVKVPAPAPRRSSRARAAPGSKGKAAFTLRLDPERHLKLRLACAVSGRSAQLLVTDALDQLLSGMPELDAMAQKANRKG